MMKEINRIGESSNHHSRNGAKVFWWCLHTEEGNQTAQGLHDWMKRNNVSYHYTGRGGIVIDIIDTDRCSWSAGDANPRTINFCFAGSKASQSRDVWMSEYRDDIDNAALLFVQDAAKYNPLDTRVLGQDYKAIGAGVAGAIDHSGITFGLGIGNHTDVGKYFPWDFFSECVVNHLLGSNPVPLPKPVEKPKNAINELAAAKGFEWIGKRETKDEIELPDGVGRLAVFENAHVYWSPMTGAYAIPQFLFEEYAEHGYERGIGYPINNHGMEPGGEVQGFENGTLYRQYGESDNKSSNKSSNKYTKNGYWVHGAIMDAYRWAGCERGIYGWPTSEEEALGTDGARVQDFEGGRIIWSPNGTIGMKPVDGPDEYIQINH